MPCIGFSREKVRVVIVEIVMVIVGDVVNAYISQDILYIKSLVSQFYRDTSDFMCLLSSSVMGMQGYYFTSTLQSRS